MRFKSWGRCEAAHVNSVSNTARFLFIATGAFAGVGAIATLVPMISQMEPDASTLAARGPVEFDASKLRPGQQAVVRWRSRPIFIVNRLRCRMNVSSPVYWMRGRVNCASRLMRRTGTESIDPIFGVVMGICTHLGCTPGYFPDPNAQTPAANWLGGYFCPCHGLKYDLAGRVFAGVRAPYNLPVPPYRLINDTIRIAENSPDVTWGFESIAQI